MSEDKDIVKLYVTTIGGLVTIPNVDLKTNKLTPSGASSLCLQAINEQYIVLSIPWGVIETVEVTRHHDAAKRLKKPEEEILWRSNA